MKEASGIIINLAIRSAIGVIAMILVLRWLDWLSAFGFIMILPIAFLVARPIAKLISLPTGSLFFPNQHFDKPQPVYGIPESRRREGRYEEAMLGFRKIVNEHSGESRAWIQMIDIAITDLHDRERALQLYNEGMNRLQKEEDRNYLRRIYEAIGSKMNPTPNKAVVGTLPRGRVNAPHR